MLAKRDVNLLVRALKGNQVGVELKKIIIRLGLLSRGNMDFLLIHGFNFDGVMLSHEEIIKERLSGDYVFNMDFYWREKISLLQLIDFYFGIYEEKGAQR